MSARCRPESRTSPQAHPQKRKSPTSMRPGFSVSWVPDDVLLSHGIHRTIIGAEAFHGPVRNGKGWGHLAIVVRRSAELSASSYQLSAKSHCSEEVRELIVCGK